MDRNDLSEPFDLAKFKQLVAGLVESKFYDDTRAISYSSDVVLNASNIGHFLDDRFQNILVVRHTASISARVKLALDTFKLMAENNIDSALIAYVSTNDPNEWRFSYASITLDESKGKIKRTFSNPRRYSYVLGKNAKTLTPYLHLVRKGVVSSMDELQKRFSLEVVNKDFYNSIALLYTKLVGGQRKQGNSTIDYPGLLKIHGKASQSIEHQEFAVRLIGRLVFCWFLREKKSATGTSLIPDSVLSAQAAKNTMYYHKVLEPLFFELLNQKLISRKEPFKKEPFSLIPYLNGGLFSPQKGSNGDYYEYSESSEGGALGVIDVPDSWLQEFTELLETYNFTVDENTSQDIELSVDPEMLGRIFENLLAEINPETGESARKSTGSFYTPREVVEYMVDRSLVYFLSDKTSINEPKLNALVSYGLEDDELHPRTESENKAVVDALSKLTILDPACGSGAYPIGILQKVVYILQQVDPDAKYWLEKQIGNVSPELKRHIEIQYSAKNYDYLRKLGVIRESIFGVDIQPVATEIARLRCFLTLIVEESVNDDAENRGIEALPNLDFKFVTANSLISLPEDKEKPANEQQGMFEDIGHIDELRRIRDNYFGANPEEKLSLQAQFNSLQTDMAIKNMDEYKGAASKRYDALSRWRPFEHKLVDWFDTDWMFGTKEFDIVIANPPYLAEKGHAELFRIIKSDGLADFYVGKMDLFYFFFHHSLNMCSDKGIVSFITTNYYPTATYANKLRRDFKNRATLLRFVNFNELKIFESAVGQHNLLTFVRKGISDESCNTAITKRKGSPLNAQQTIREILSWNDKETDYFNKPQDKMYNNLGNIDLRDNPLSNLLESLSEKHFRIDSYYKISKGLETGNNKVFIFDELPTFYNELIVSEKAAFRPFYKNSDINKYHTETVAGKYVLYIDKKFNLETSPRLSKYLLNYRESLESRAQIKRSNQPWYQLLWPRSEKMFQSEKIVAPYRSKGNVFSMIEHEWFSGTDTYFIYGGVHSLKLALAILNSKFAFVWFKNKGAVKGDVLELKGDVIASLPLPKLELINNEIIKLIEAKIDDIIGAIRLDKSVQIHQMQSAIDQIIYQIYELNSEEIAIIENNA